MLSKEITFIIQGPTYGKDGEKYAFHSSNSIRKFFPDSTIILSTWSNQNLEQINYDKLLLNIDPGAEIAIDQSKTLNNVNRQIVSTFAGLKESKTKYSIKIRSDLVLTNDNLIKVLKLRPKKIEQMPLDLLKEYVLVSNVTSINPKSRLVLPHHPCDWIYAGLTEDLYKIWNIDPMPKNWFRYFENNPWPTEAWHETNYLSLFRPESYIWSAFLKKQTKISFMSSFDNSKKNLELSERYLALNLMILKNKTLGIKSLKNKITNITLLPSYTEKEWKLMASKYGRKSDLKISEVDHLLISQLRKFEIPIIAYMTLKGTVLTKLSLIKKSYGQAKK